MSTKTIISDEEVLNITERLLADLEMFFRYDVLLTEISKNKPDIRLSFMRIIHCALQNDLLTRLLRVFDPSSNSYNINRVLNERGALANSICEKHSLPKKDITKFRDKLNDVRNKYHFHIDASNAATGFNPQKEFWDSQGLSMDVLRSKAVKVRAILIDLYNSIAKQPYISPNYTGDDFAKLLNLVDEKGFEYFYQAETDLQ